MSELEAALLDDVSSLLGRWRVEYAADPDAEREHLWLLALEREQVVAVAYREDFVAARLADLAVDDELHALVRQTLVWIWKDEELHAEYLRGLLLHRGGVLASLGVYGRQAQGALSGWATATEHHRPARSAPLRTGVAHVLVAVGRLSGQVPAILRRELRYQTFHRYCELNVALEATAELAYRRLVELATSAEEEETFERIRADEARHGAAFRVLGAALTAEDRAAPPRRPRTCTGRWRSSAPGSCPPRSGPTRRGTDARSGPARRSRCAAAATTTTGSRCSTRASTRPGSGCRASGATTAAVRVSFMLGYDRRDRSNINDPVLVEGLARYLRRHGVEDVAVLEAPTVYGNIFANRSVEEVAAYFGFTSPAYRIVDISRDLRPFVFERGFVQRTITGTWLDADLRNRDAEAANRPHRVRAPVLVDLGGQHGRDRRDLLRQTPSRLPLSDDDAPRRGRTRLRGRRRAWSPVADGPFGVMGCHRPADVRHLYAGADTSWPSTRSCSRTSGSTTRGRLPSFAGPTTGSVSTPVLSPSTGSGRRCAPSCAAPARVAGAAGSRHCLVPGVRVPEQGR